MDTTKPRKPWLQTYTGGVIDPENIVASDINIEDIAHALGMLCRYCGHTQRFYSVAEHCVIMSRVLPVRLKMYGLIHDSSEAYLTDLPRPIKCLLPEYKALEEKLEPIVYKALKIRPPTKEEHDAVKIADIRMLAVEQAQLMPPPTRAYVWAMEPYDLTLPCWSPDAASIMFHSTFNDLRRIWGETQ